MLAPALTRHFKDLNDLNFEVLDTGLETATGGRLKQCINYSGSDRFLATYGDGVCNINLEQLIRTHELSENIVTLTSVRPPARFGRVVLEGNQVIHFGEKNQSDEGWINGGFFLLDKEILKYISDDSISFEGYPLSRLAEDRKLGAYLHKGFWQPMDTLREKNDLEALWNENKAPWKIW
jgi:glucose-1-phosphate cytidylyltransferase